VVLVWELATAIANSDRLIDAERALGVLVEPDAIRAFAARPALLDAANWFYSRGHRRAPRSGPPPPQWPAGSPTRSTRR
jgi:hypothetical protein